EPATGDAKSNAAATGMAKRTFDFILDLLGAGRARRRLQAVRSRTLKVGFRRRRGARPVSTPGPGRATARGSAARSAAAECRSGRAVATRPERRRRIARFPL